MKSAMAGLVLKYTSQEVDDDPITPGVTIFTGIHATFSKGDYMSIEGELLEAIPIKWAVGEPNNLGNAEQCLAITFYDEDDSTEDTKCDRKLPYICYKYDAAHSYRYDYEWNIDVEGWFKYHMIPAPFDSARRRCEAEGAVLAAPTTKKMQAAVLSFVRSQDTVDELGVTILTGFQQSSDGFFTSTKGEMLQTSSITWTPGHPKHQMSKQCLAMKIGSEGTMATESCDTVLPYVCYKTKTTLKITECGTNDPEYHREPETGSCYKFFKNGLVWSDAFMTCSAEGGYLAIINDDTEAKVIKRIIDNYPIDTINAPHQWVTSVGAHDWGHFGRNFMTIDGESLDVNYHTWMKGEPNNGTNHGPNHPVEYCMTVVRPDNVLNDYVCDVPAAFICEKNPRSLINDLDFSGTY